jgi:hypothetical protein
MSRNRNEPKIITEKQRFNISYKNINQIIKKMGKRGFELFFSFVSPFITPLKK